MVMRVLLLMKSGHWVTHRKTLSPCWLLILHVTSQLTERNQKNDLPQIWWKDKILSVQKFQYSPRAGESISDVIIHSTHSTAGSDHVCAGVQCAEAPGVQRGLWHGRAHHHGLQRPQVHTWRRWGFLVRKFAMHTLVNQNEKGNQSFDLLWGCLFTSYRLGGICSFLFGLPFSGYTKNENFCE